MFIRIKKTIFLILSIMLIAIGLVSVLAWKALRPMKEKTEFTRKLISSPVLLANVIDKPVDVLDFSGATDHHIYFKTKDPSKVYMTDMELQNGKYLSVNVPNDPTIASMFNCMVDSPYVYIAAGNSRAIIKCKPGNTPTLYKLPEAVFTRTTLISDNSIAVRMFDKLDQVFAKRNLNTGEIKKENNISEKKRDAGISTDGTLLFDKQTNKLVYVQNCQTEIIIMDTNLNLVKKVKTINKNNSTQMNVEEISGKNTITSVSPKRLLNAASCVSNGFLYVNSVVKADNEIKSMSTSNSVIDIYNLTTGDNKESFYVPAYKDEKIRKFWVLNNSLLFVEYKNFIVSYKLTFKITQ